MGTGENAIENAKENAKEKNFFAKVLSGIHELVNIRVTTVIGNFKPDTSVTKDDLIDGRGQDAMITNMILNEAMLSKVDFITGDISTTMTGKFASDKDLREYHSLHENQAHEIVLRNIKVLEATGKLIVDFIKKKSENT